MRSAALPLLVGVLLAQHADAAACATDGSNLDACDSLTGSVTCGAACKAGTWTNSVLKKTDGWDITFSSTSVALDVTFSALLSTSKYEDEYKELSTGGSSLSDFGDIYFTTWPGTALSFPKLKFAYRVKVSDAPNLVRFDFPALVHADYFHADGDCAKLESFSAPNLVSVGELLVWATESPTATGFGKLKSLSFPSLRIANNFDCDSTMAVTSISAPLLQAVYDLNIEYNEELVTVSMPKLLAVSDWADIYNNRKLALLDTPQWAFSGYGGDLYGNGGLAPGGTVWLHSSNSQVAALEESVNELGEASSSSVSVTFFSIVNFVLLLVIGAMTFMNRPKAAVGAQSQA